MLLFLLHFMGFPLSQFLFSKSKKQMGCYQNKVSVITLDEEISHYVHCLMWEPAEGFSNKYTFEQSLFLSLHSRILTSDWC